MTEELLSVAQAAEELGVTRRMVNQYCRNGRLKAQRVGRDWVIFRADLDAFAKRARPVGRPKSS